MLGPQLLLLGTLEGGRGFTWDKQIVADLFLLYLVLGS